MTRRTPATLDDLNLAIEWLEDGFEAGDDTESREALDRVAAMLRAEVERREVDKLARTYAAAYADSVGRKADEPEIVRAARKIARAGYRQAGR